MKTLFNKPTLLFIIPFLASAVIAHGATINLVGNDALGASSFNSGLNWSGSAAPSGANDYNTAGFQMRTPGDGAAAYTFAGASLTLGDHASAGAGNGSILEKFTLGAASVRTLTINNLTNATGGLLRSGGTAGALIHIAGNHYTIAGTSAIWADQCIWVIDAPLLGGDSIILTNFANNANDHVAYSGDNSGFTGSWYLQGAGTTAWSLELDGLSSLPGNPSTLNPGQITFLAGGQFRDIVGCSYTNSNGGITLVANGTFNVSATTLIGVPITDLTNGVHSLASLTSSGTGTLILSNANNNYSGGTTISAGILRMGVDNAIPGNSIAGNVTANGTLDLNGHVATINGLNGTGAVDSQSGGSATLTVGANGANGTFTGTIQNSSGALSLTKVGAGTQTVGGYTYSGATTVAAGTLSLSSGAGVPSSPGDLVVSNGATLTANVSSGTPLPVANMVEGTNTTVSLTLSSSANGINAASLTLQDNATNNFNYGIVAANPTAPAINVSGGISAPGTSIVINISAIGLKTGTFTLIKYGSGTLANIANFQLSPPPGVAATLVNNTGNQSIDVSITSIPNQLAWNGMNGTSWDLVTANWTNLGLGGITVFRQYTNGSVIAGDAVTFDDSLTNDFVNPQPTNIVLNSRFFAFPFVVNSTLPYSIAGSGGINGVTSLVKSNSGSLTLLTSNSFSGGVSLNDSGTLVITNDSALGASSVGLTLNGATLQMNGGVTNNRPISMPNASSIAVGSGATARLSGVISGAGILNKRDAGTLILAGAETFTGNLFAKGGTLVIDSGGSINNGGLWTSIGQDGSDVATLTLQGTGSFTNTADFNVGDIDGSTGTLNISGTASVSVNQLFIASANNAGSTAVGTVNMNGGSLIERNTAAGNFVVGGRNAASSSGVAIINLTNGFISGACGIRIGDFGTGTVNQYGGTFEATNNGTGINLHRENTSTSFGTYNLNGGTLRTEKVTTSFATVNSLFYFNGGILQAANGNLGATPFFNALVHAYVRNGAAIIDSQIYNITVAQPLEHSNLGGDNATDGGLTKRGSGSLTLTMTNTFTGPITNSGGTMFLNSTSSYPGGAFVNSGTLQITTASTIGGTTLISNNASLSIGQVGSATANLGNLTFNGLATTPGGTLAVAPTLANNPNVALVNCNTLTLNGTNSISLPVGSLGTLALIKYTGAIAGSGNCTNLLLPQGASGFISNNAASSTLYAVITSTGPGIFWTGTNSVAGRTNLWDISTTTNWLVNTTPTAYRQVVIPGDIVTFSDIGSGVVLLSNNVGPAALTISNNSKNYTFSGPGTISGPTGLRKLGSSTATLNLTNNNYTGPTAVSNGTLQVGSLSALSPGADLLVGPSGKLELNGFNQSVGEMTGSGVVSNSSGLDMLLTVGTGNGGTWNGSIQDAGHGGVALIKRGSGTWVVGGNNRLGNGSPFITTNIFLAGTTIITNGGSIISPRLQTGIGFGGASTATVIMGGGTLAVSNDVLAVGFLGANGTLVVNSGTVVHGGGTQGAFGAPNNLIVGSGGGTGTLTVNGGQVQTSQALWLGQNAGGSGTLYLNGGVVQANIVQPNNTPTTSIAYFNGGTLRAGTNSGDLLQVTSMVMSNGLVLDDGGFAVNLVTAPLQAGDAFNGGVTKQGTGTIYLDNANTYTGTTLVNNGTLAGAGAIVGPVVVNSGGAIGAGDAGGVGTLTVNNNLTIQGKAAMRIDKTGGGLNSDLITGLGTANYGGTLVISNITSDATPLVAGDTFTLFSASSHAGNFANIVGSPGGSLGFSFANGVLTVIATDPNPINLNFSFSGNTLTLSWPPNHLGWYVQSNSVDIANAATWFDIPGSQSVTTLNITVNPAQSQVFFRMRHP